MSLFGDDIPDHNDDDFDDFAMDNSEGGATLRETLQLPQKSDYCIGHEKIEADMLSLWNAGRMPHALVLNGVKGIGKATFAYRLARFVLKESAENTGGGLFGEETHPETLAVPSDHSIFSKVSSGGHPDMMVVGRPFDEKKGQHKNEIPVDDIRKVAPFLRKTSSEGGWRVVIIDDANCMNRNGQNALLKILEEPPEKALLILVTHGVGGLLPTIRSRCRFVPFQPLDHDAVTDILTRAAGTPILPADADIITSLAEGSAGQAVALYQENGVQTVSDLLHALTSVQDLSGDAIDALALTYGKSGDTKLIDGFVFILNWWFDTLIRMAATGQGAKHIGNLTLHVPENHNLQSLLRLHEEVDNHIKTCINGNLDKRYMIYKTLRMIQNG